MISSGAMAAILSLLLEGSAQTITFGGPPPALRAKESATVTAVASSKLPVTFSSKTPDVCSVVANSGVVAAKAAGNCTIAADQGGNGEYDPAPQVTMTIAVAEAIPVPDPQTISFGFAPAVVKGGTVPISATASSGLPVMYTNNTKDVCTLTNASGGFTVTGNMVGKCRIVANQGGNAKFNPAPPVELVIAVVVAPDTPTNVKASLGDEQNTVVVSFDAPASGSSPITGYSVVGTKQGGANIAVPGTASPITVPCPVSCSGYAFSVAANNAVAGTGTATAPVDVITTYRVVETFSVPEAVSGAKKSIDFDGTFTFNSTKGEVSNLAGRIRKYRGEGKVELKYQQSVEPFSDSGETGLLVTTFALNTTDTFLGPGELDVAGWLPELGVGRGAFTTLNESGSVNAYARIFVNTENPLKPLTQAQLNRLAYVECTQGEFLCMIGTTWVADDLGGGNWGVYVSTLPWGDGPSWYGHPVSQVITRQ